MPRRLHTYQPCHLRPSLERRMSHAEHILLHQIFNIYFMTWRTFITSHFSSDIFLMIALPNFLPVTRQTRQLAPQDELGCTCSENVEKQVLPVGWCTEGT